MDAVLHQTPIYRNNVPVKRPSIIAIWVILVFHDRFQIKEDACARLHLVQCPARNSPGKLQARQLGGLAFVDSQVVHDHATTMEEITIRHLKKHLHKFVVGWIVSASNSCAWSITFMKHVGVIKWIWHLLDNSIATQRRCWTGLHCLRFQVLEVHN